MRILITAGPTREAIDPVRYLSNRSSGKMGYAIAEAAIAAGHEVLLVSGPVSLTAPAEAELISVESAAQMYAAVRVAILRCDVAIHCAAVADYRPAQIASEKLKKTSENLTLELEKTEDILGSCRSPFGFEGTLIGFAAETENLEANALAKLERKGCDYLVANDVSRKDIGFDQDENEVIIFGADGSRQALAKQEKRELGKAILELIPARENP